MSLSPALFTAKSTSESLCGGNHNAHLRAFAGRNKRLERARRRTVGGRTGSGGVLACADIHNQKSHPFFSSCHLAHGSFISFRLITFSGSVACMSSLSGGDDELFINWQSGQ